MAPRKSKWVRNPKMVEWLAQNPGSEPLDAPLEIRRLKNSMTEQERADFRAEQRAQARYRPRKKSTNAPAEMPLETSQQITRDTPRQDSKVADNDDSNSLVSFTSYHTSLSSAWSRELVPLPPDFWPRKPSRESPVETVPPPPNKNRPNSLQGDSTNEPLPTLIKDRRPLSSHPPSKTSREVIPEQPSMAKSASKFVDEVKGVIETDEARKVREEVEEDQIGDEMTLDFHLYMGARRLIEWREAELEDRERHHGFHARFTMNLIDSKPPSVTISPPFPRAPSGLGSVRDHALPSPSCQAFQPSLPTVPAYPFSPTIEELKQLRLSHVRRQSLQEGDTASLAKIMRQDSSLPLGLVRLKRNREMMLESLLPARVRKLKANDASEEGSEDALFDTFGTREMPSLRDLLPGFMALTAHRAAISEHGWWPTQTWMQLAAEWMLQAVLEQFLICGAKGSGLIAEIFSYSHKPDNEARRGTSIDEDDKLIHGFFVQAEEDSGDAVTEWNRIINTTIRLLTPPDDTTMLSHLESLSERYPIADFEGRVAHFLGSMLESFPRPWIVQLEDGKLDFLTEEETAQLKRELLWDDPYAKDEEAEQMDLDE